MNGCPERALAVRGLSVAVRRAGREGLAVDLLDLDLERGRTLCLVGESGCGKTLAALALMRLLPPSARITAGTVQLQELELLRLPERQMRGVRGARMAMVFQEPMTSLNPVMTIGAQIGEAIRVHEPRAKAVERRVIDLLAQVGIPDPAARRLAYPFQLSGGQKQRVMIAMALAANPDILIADEPTTALDVTLQAQILDLLERLQAERGLALLLVTHDLGVVRRMASRVAVMYAGQIVEAADAEAFFAQPQHPYARRLFAALPGRQRAGHFLADIPGRVPSPGMAGPGCRFAPRCDWTAPGCAETQPLHVLSAAHQVRCCRVTAGETPLPDPPIAAAVPRTAGRPLLEVRDLSVHFPLRRGLFRRSASLCAVDSVHLDIATGTTLALVGESGSGKTTLARALLQLIRPSGGSIRLEGADLTSLSAAALRSRRADLQMIFQDPYASLDPRMRIEAIVAEGLAALRPDLSAAGRAARVARVLADVGLPEDAGARYPHEFSGGQRQRIAIARALAVEPKLIVCDEPTSALDVSVQAQILNLLRRLQGERSMAYLLISHNLGVVAHMADVVAVLYLGRIVEAGPAAAVLDRPLHPYTQALLAASPLIEAAPGRPQAFPSGEPPSLLHPPAGCPYHPRCPQATDTCRTTRPPETATADGRRVVCWHLPPVS